MVGIACCNFGMNHQNNHLPTTFSCLCHHFTSCRGSPVNFFLYTSRATFLPDVQAGVQNEKQVFNVSISSKRKCFQIGFNYKLGLTKNTRNNFLSGKYFAIGSPKDNCFVLCNLIHFFKFSNCFRIFYMITNQLLVNNFTKTFYTLERKYG